jgi:hypothetical protein
VAIFQKLTRSVEGAADLLEIKARSVATAFGEVGAALIVALIGGLLGIVMILGLLAALTAVLWEPIGPGGALAIAALAAGVLALIALAIGRWLIGRVGNPPPETTLRQKEWSARERLNMRTPPRFSSPPPRRSELPPGAGAWAFEREGDDGFSPRAAPPPDDASAPRTGPKNVRVTLAKKAYEHPKIAAGAAFAAVAILGPKRSLRTLTRGLALASVAASVARVAGEAIRQVDDSDSPPRATPAPDRTRRAAESSNGAAGSVSDSMSSKSRIV